MKWKSDPESVPEIGSPLKVNQFFQFVGIVITPSFNKIGWLLSYEVILDAEWQAERIADKQHLSHNSALADGMTQVAGGACTGRAAWEVRRNCSAPSWTSRRNTRRRSVAPRRSTSPTTGNSRYRTTTSAVPTTSWPRPTSHSLDESRYNHFDGVVHRHSWFNNAVVGYDISVSK